MPKIAGVITSTADLEPDGLAGYAKWIVAGIGFLGALLAFIEPYFPEGSDWARWLGIAIALCGWLGTYLVANVFKPVVVAPAGPADEVPGGAL